MTPCVLGVPIHGFAESIPLLVGIDGLTTTGISRRGGHVIVLLVLLRCLSLNVTVDVHGDNFSKEAIGVISQVVRVGEDLLHTTSHFGDVVSLLSLLNQKIL